MRKPLIIGNWKMNTNLADATILATQVKNAVADLGVDVVGGFNSVTTARIVSS